MTSPVDSKKRKAEGGARRTPEQVAPLITDWTPEQLSRILAQLGTDNEAVLQAIVRENQIDPKQRKIFVRNLPYNITSGNLGEFFSKYGTVTEAVIVMDKNTGGSKGFGFVTFETVDSANACLETTTKDMNGRPVYINLAAKKDGISSSVSSVGGAVKKSDEDLTMKKLFVWSLSFETTSTQLHEFFTTFGDVTEAIVLTNRDTGTSKGYGFVTMASAEGAALALMEPVKQFAGRSIHVKLAAAHDGKTATPSSSSSGTSSAAVVQAYTGYPVSSYPYSTGYAGYPTGYPGYSGYSSALPATGTPAAAAAGATPTQTQHTSAYTTTTTGYQPGMPGYGWS